LVFSFFTDDFLSAKYTDYFVLFQLKLTKRTLLDPLTITAVPAALPIFTEFELYMNCRY